MGYSDIEEERVAHRPRASCSAITLAPSSTSTTSGARGGDHDRRVILQTARACKRSPDLPGILCSKATPTAG